MSAQSQQSARTVVLTRTPKLYQVTLHNDNYTQMDFVVNLLMRVFHKSAQEASAIMLAVHQQGAGTAGVYTYDIAVTKKAQADQLAQEADFPLKVTVEEAER